jgi:NIPSNAP protein
MLKTHWRLIAFTAIVFAAGLLAGGVLQGTIAHAQAGRRVFELRTYTAPDGKLDALNARFRNHTVKIFQRHSMTSVGYWVPQDAPSSQNTLVYILAHPDRETAKKNWAAFQADPEWQKARAESEAQGRLTSKVESVFMEPTDYSPMK